MPMLLLFLFSAPLAVGSWFIAAVFGLNALLVEGTVNSILLGYAITYAPWIVAAEFFLSVLFFFDIKPRDMPPATNHKIFHNLAYIIIMAFAPVSGWVVLMTVASAAIYEFKVAANRQALGLHPAEASPFAH